MKSPEGIGRKAKAVIASLAGMATVMGAEAPPAVAGDVFTPKNTIERSFVADPSAESDVKALEALQAAYNNEHQADVTLKLSSGVVYVLNGTNIIGKIYQWKNAKKTPISSITTETIQDAIKNYTPQQPRIIRE